MKKIISIVLTAVCAAALFAGCSAKAPEAAAEDGNVSLDGSTSMEKVMGSLVNSSPTATPAPHIHTILPAPAPASRLYLKAPVISASPAAT